MSCQLARVFLIEQVRVASRPCIFDPLCSVTSDRHILASRGPISLRFGQEVPSEILLTSGESHVTCHYRCRVFHRVVACSHQEKENKPDANYLYGRWSSF